MYILLLLLLLSLLEFQGLEQQVISNQNQDYIYILEESLKAMLLCHNTKTKFDKKHRDVLSHETLIKQHARALKFCVDLGFSFEGSLKISDGMIHSYKIKVFEYNEFYPILAINNYSKNRNRFSILVGEKYSISSFNDESKATLYVWSCNLNSIINLLNISEGGKEILKENSQNLKELGYQIMFYCKKELSNEEKNEFLHKKEVKQSGFNFDDEQLDDLYNETECNLDYIVGVYFEYTLKKFVPETIECFKDAKMKLCLLSDDNEEKTMSVAYKSKIIGLDSKTKRLIANDNESLINIIKYILNNLKKDIVHHNDLHGHHDLSVTTPKKRKSKKKNVINSPANFFKIRDKFVLVTNGKTLELIQKGKYSYNHFKFLLMFCSHFICFESPPLLRKQLIVMVKELIKEKFDLNVMAIGNNPGDFMMLQEADISFEIHSEKFASINADIFCDSFKNLNDIICVHARLNCELMVNIIYWFLFSGNVVTYFRFLYDFFAYFSQTEVIPTILYTLVFKNLLILSILCFYLCKPTKNPLFLKNYPILYKKKPVPIKFEINNFIFKIILPSVISSGFIFIFVLFDDFGEYVVSKTIDEFQIEVFLALSFLIYFQVHFIFFLF